MLSRSYITSITNIIKALGLSSSWVFNLGRVIVLSALELEEVGGLDKRAIGNWEADVYDRHYDTKLPLAAMRDMRGHDSRRRCFNHTRSVFYGNATHENLPSFSLPWMDEAVVKVWNTENHTAFGVLALLKQLR